MTPFPLHPNPTEKVTDHAPHVDRLRSREVPMH